MKRLLILASLFINSAVVGQVRVPGEEILQAIEDTPQEEVFVHYNSSLLFVGEYLYYRLYCLNSETENLSQLSKIAYVELVGEEGKPVFRHKLALDAGVGQGDFFIPPSVPSGNYKLLGYTRWMLNGEEQQFFSGELVIINPYNNAQDALLSGKTTPQGEGFDGGAEKGQSVNASDKLQSPSGLRTDAGTYGRREKVTATLEGLDPEGNYSLSVRKLEPIQVPVMKSGNSAVDKTSTPFSPEIKSAVWLPEMRGELFTGVIIPREGSINASPANKAVSLSIPDEDYILRISGTDEKGRFFFNVQDLNLEEEAIIQVLGEDREKFEVKLQEFPAIDYSRLDFGNFLLTPAMKDMIIARSVYNQVENAYFEAKPDTLKLKPEAPPFYGQGMQVYQLDEYTRFKTVKETFVEIIKFASIGKDATGDDVINMVGINQTVPSSLPPLLIVDGVQVQEQGDFINYPAERIKSIGILRDKYFLGAEVFQGIVDVETLEGNFNVGRNKEYLHSLNLLRPEPKKYYFRQNYSGENNKFRIPDFRTQLLWDPEVDLHSAPTVEFFTSDISGDYQLSLEGFTSEGEAVSYRKMIKVE